MTGPGAVLDFNNTTGPEDIEPDPAGPVRIATDGNDDVRARITVDEVQISSVAREPVELVTAP